MKIFSSTPIQLAARHSKVENEKETVGRWWRSSILGAWPVAIHLTYLPRQVEEVLATHTPFEHSETSTLDLCDGLNLEVMSM